MKILHTLWGLGGTALAAAVALPRNGNPNIPLGINTVLREKKQVWWCPCTWSHLLSHSCTINLAPLVSKISPKWNDSEVLNKSGVQKNGVSRLHCWLTNQRLSLKSLWHVHKEKGRKPRLVEHPIQHRPLGHTNSYKHQQSVIPPPTSISYITSYKYQLYHLLQVSAIPPPTSISYITSYKYQLSATPPPTSISYQLHHLQQVSAISCITSYKYQLSAISPPTSISYQLYHLQVSAISHTTSYKYQLSAIPPPTSISYQLYHLLQVSAISYITSYKYQLSAIPPPTSISYQPYHILQVSAISHTTSYKYQLSAIPHPTSTSQGSTLTTW